MSVKQTSTVSISPDATAAFNASKPSVPDISFSRTRVCAEPDGLQGGLQPRAGAASDF
jgi:hypothetical protein